MKRNEHLYLDLILGRSDRETHNPSLQWTAFGVR